MQRERAYRQIRDRSACVASYPPPSVVMSHHTERGRPFEVTMVYLPDCVPGFRASISEQLVYSPIQVMRKCNAPSTSRKVSNAFNRENLCTAALTSPDAFKADAMPSKYSNELLAPDTRWENNSVTGKNASARVRIKVRGSDESRKRCCNVE